MMEGMDVEWGAVVWAGASAPALKRRLRPMPHAIGMPIHSGKASCLACSLRAAFRAVPCETSRLSAAQNRSRVKADGTQRGRKRTDKTDRQRDETSLQQQRGAYIRIDETDDQFRP